MTDETKKKNDTEVLADEISGEVLPPAEVEPRALARPLTPFSTSVIVNKFTERGLRSYRRVIQEETGLMEDLGQHKKTKSKLRDLDLEIATERLERQQRLHDALLKEKLAEKSRRLAELDLDVEIAAREKRLEELKKPERGPEKTAAERQAEHLEKMKEQLSFSARKDAIKLFGEFETRKEIEKEYERRRQEVLAGRPEDSLTKEEQRALEDLADAKHYALDKL